MPVTTRQNKQGRKGGGVVFRLCTKASLYALLVWIVNCSNSSQYGGNSYHVMNNGLGKAMDSRTLRLLAEAYEEDIEQDGPIVYDEEAIEQDGETTGEVGAEEQDGPAVYEEAIEQDGPAVYEEAIEQDGPVVHEEDIEEDGPVVYDEETIEQDGPVVHDEEAVEQDGEIPGEVAEEEQVVQKAPSVSSVQEQVMQKAPSVSSVQEQVMQKAPSVPSVQEQVALQVPKNLTKGRKIQYKDDGSILVQSVDLNEQPELIKRYEKRKIDVRDNFKPTITYNFEDALKRCIAFDARIHDRDQDCLNVGSYRTDADPYGVLQKKNKKTVQTGYLRMYQNNFSNLPDIDDLKNNEELEEPYLERKYVRPHLTPASPKTTALKRNVERKIYKEEDHEEQEEVEEVKGKKKKRRRFCCF
ncbi:Uncharacterized protein PCOAH_00047620 [Plasmodium coatneyi]|uniref:Uncharacterized protein n=1 Tax=Plasmodium coatneyi TaxID=208452 RepID=A0A1B1E440_9APIC|nr:Uncharacterized protein PCOAH_00047620 [Plasmodium coatneyi]ANQ09778.1 Uncharacterized protein PCOAH_00047620 [Plasmodium coatneyi]